MFYSKNIAALLSLIISVVIATVACSNRPLDFTKQRAEMIRQQIEQRGINDPLILNAFSKVPREEFILPEYKNHAYDDIEAPIGLGQSLDRPYDDALMIKAMAINPASRVLEVGTGMGYLASLISQIAKEMYTIEIEPQLAQKASALIKKLGYNNVQVKNGDGFLGWPEHAPFDAIILTCSPPEIPKPLIEQLAEGGRIVLPQGGAKKFQEILLYVKKNGKLSAPVRLAPAEFVPMKGKILEK